MRFSKLAMTARDTTGACSYASHPTDQTQVEIVVWLAVFLLLFCLSWFFDWHEGLDGFIEKHHDYPLDHALLALNISGFLGLIYSALRISDLSREVHRRLQAERTWTGLPVTTR